MNDTIEQAFEKEFADISEDDISPQAWNWLKEWLNKEFKKHDDTEIRDIEMTAYNNGFNHGYKKREEDRNREMAHHAITGE